MREPITSASYFIGQGNQQLISFGSGQPDLPPPKEAYEALAQFSGFKYGAVQGEESLRQALARDYPGAQPHEFVITNGASEAIDLALRAIAVPGGRVLLPRPYYYSYPHNVALAGMESDYYDLDENGKINFEVFAKLVPGARAVLINSPSNPTGTVQEVDTLKKIEALCEELGVYILSDEVYKDLIYVRENYLLQGSRVITINSFSKTYGMCGLRIGYLYSKNVEAVQGAIEIKTHTSMNTSVASQAMALAAMQSRDPYVESHVKIWERRRDMIYDGMRGMGLELYKPEGAFYVLPKFPNPTQAMHDLYFDYELITYDGTWFGAPDRLRFSYALDEDKIAEGLRRVGDYLKR